MAILLSTAAVAIFGMEFKIIKPGSLICKFVKAGRPVRISFSRNDDIIGGCKLTHNIYICTSSYGRIHISRRITVAGDELINIENVCQSGPYQVQFDEKIVANCNVTDKEVCSGSKGKLPNMEAVIIGIILALVCNGVDNIEIF